MPRPEDRMELSRLKNGMQAQVSSESHEETDETKIRDNPAFQPRPAGNDLGPRIFLSVPSEPEDDDEELYSVL